jgi:hypothetical protein
LKNIFLMIIPEGKAECWAVAGVGTEPDGLPTITWSSEVAKIERLLVYDLEISLVYQTYLHHEDV